MTRLSPVPCDGASTPPSDVAAAPPGNGASPSAPPWRRCSRFPDGPPKLQPDFPVAFPAQRHHDNAAAQVSLAVGPALDWLSQCLKRAVRHRGIRASGATRQPLSLQRLTATLRCHCNVPSRQFFMFPLEHAAVLFGLRSDNYLLQIHQKYNSQIRLTLKRVLVSGHLLDVPEVRSIMFLLHL